MKEHVRRFTAYKEQRSQDDVRRGLDSIARAANSPSVNIYAKVVEAAELGVTHGEIVSCLRRELGFGQPLIVA
jgi:methylmalonyl-CoA mutase N-terminal domain/subunit